MKNSGQDKHPSQPKIVARQAKALQNEELQASEKAKKEKENEKGAWQEKRDKKKDSVSASKINITSAKKKQAKTRTRITAEMETFLRSFVIAAINKVTRLKIILNQKASYNLRNLHIDDYKIGD